MQDIFIDQSVCLLSCLLCRVQIIDWLLHDKPITQIHSLVCWPIFPMKAYRKLYHYNFYMEFAQQLSMIKSQYINLNASNSSYKTSLCFGTTIRLTNQTNMSFWFAFPFPERKTLPAMEKMNLLTVLIRYSKISGEREGKTTMGLTYNEPCAFFWLRQEAIKRRRKVPFIWHHCVHSSKKHHTRKLQYTQCFRKVNVK